jgi:cell division protein FtsB
MERLSREQRVEREKLSRLEDRSNEFKRHNKQLEDDHHVLAERKRKIENYLKASLEEMEGFKRDLLESTKKRKELR